MASNDEAKKAELEDLVDVGFEIMLILFIDTLNTLLDIRLASYRQKKLLL